MQKRQLGASDLYVSELSLGCMSLGTEEHKAKDIIHTALDYGVNYLDTADLYSFGENEKIVGKATEGIRDQVIIGSKVGNNFDKEKGTWSWDPSPAHIKQGLKDSLHRTGLDYIDLYQLHGGTIDDPIDEVIDTFEALKKEGLIREYGISSIRPNVLRQFLQKSNIVSVMMQYNLLDRRPEEFLPLLRENDVSVLARGPLAKGMLSSKAEQAVASKGKDGFLSYDYNDLVDISEKWKDMTSGEENAKSFQYILHNETVASCVFGASSTEQVKENINAFKKATPLTDADYKQMQSLTKALTYANHR
ncbi:aldo/keto reductase [Salimicrobium halophilum]|uniref:Predicted oxidoreductase n=1 Tax=Salimicrobium halophilum TaxID=86666 RepID=A0A1G8PYN7_9BACI|nr:aldo/keto reductase [Salimicrobium halophilum]SDI96940.1 Predicted oxidoreductase [Salimicrobium halophilum]